ATSRTRASTRRHGREAVVAEAAPTAPQARGSEGVDVAECADQAAGALVGLALGRAEAVARRPAQLRGLLAGRARVLRLPVQRLRHRRRAAIVRQPQHLDLEHVLATRHAQLVAHAHRTRRLRPLAPDLDLAGLHRLPRQAAGAEEARRPQPHVDAHAALLAGGGSGLAHARILATAACAPRTVARPPNENGRPGGRPSSGWATAAALLGRATFRGGSGFGGGPGPRLGVAGQVFLDARLL